MTAPEYLDPKGFAAFVGVSPATIHTYKTKGLLPTPDAYFGQTPVWLPATAERWKAERPGQGKGGGRKPKDEASDG